MYGRTVKFPAVSLTINENKFNNKFYGVIGSSVFTRGPIVSSFRTLTHNAAILLILIPAVIAFILLLKKIYRTDGDTEVMEMENSEINKMLGQHYKSRVIVPIDGINEESITALSHAIAFSDDVTAFCFCIDTQSCEEIKKDFSLLDTDISLVVRYSEHFDAADMLLEFIQSVEYNCKNKDIITIILPRFTSRKHWRNTFTNRKLLYDESKLKSHENVVVMTMHSLADGKYVASCKMDFKKK